MFLDGTMKIVRHLMLAISHAYSLEDDSDDSELSYEEQLLYFVVFRCKLCKLFYFVNCAHRSSPSIIYCPNNLVCNK